MTGPLSRAPSEQYPTCVNHLTNKLYRSLALQNPPWYIDPHPHELEIAAKRLKHVYARITLRISPLRGIKFHGGFAYPNVHVLQSRVCTPKLILYRQDGIHSPHCQSSVGRPISIICIHQGVFSIE